MAVAALKQHLENDLDVKFLQVGLNMNVAKKSKGNFECNIAGTDRCQIVFSGDWTIYSNHEDIFPKIEEIVSRKRIKETSEKGALIQKLLGL